MANLEDLGEVVSTDLLIVGGGIGGLCAAIRAKEVFPDIDVLIVDKQTIGYAGKASKGGGILWALGPEDDLEEFVELHVKEIGDYLNDQELLYAYSREMYRNIEQLADWGVNVQKDEAGKLSLIRREGTRWSLAGVDLNMMLPLRRKARKLGARTLNKVQVVDLLKRNDRVVGATGFDIINGRFYTFKAKATVLANGSCNYKVMRMWSSANGDGIATAYRAGAEMRNAEFGNFYDILNTETNAPAVYGHNFLYNAREENIFDRYVARAEPDIPLATVLSMEKEVSEGRGPIHLDLAQWQKYRAAIYYADWKRPHFEAFHGRAASKFQKYGHPGQKPVVALAFHAELSPVKVDHEMKTTLEGLWAIGDTSYAGSAWAGAIFAPPGRMRGSGLGNALFSALRGAPSAARFASETSVAEVDPEEVKKSKKGIFAPMQRERGLLPVEAVHAIQDVIVPVKYNLRRRKDRMEEALTRIEAIQESLGELYAKDYHGLFNCHEAMAMALCAEMTFRAALARTESRGWHYREDYPEHDNKNWLKWVIVKQEGGKMMMSSEPIPIDRYKHKPSN
ncbi:MAG: FAD-dependent oxidoreductase [Thermodesulfobacteriota bacterium]